MASLTQQTVANNACEVKNAFGTKKSRTCEINNRIRKCVCGLSAVQVFQKTSMAPTRGAHFRKARMEEASDENMHRMLVKVMNVHGAYTKPLIFKCAPHACKSNNHVFVKLTHRDKFMKNRCRQRWIVRNTKGNAWSHVEEDKTKKRDWRDASNAVQVFNTNCHGMLVKLSIRKCKLERLSDPESRFTNASHKWKVTCRKRCVLESRKCTAGGSQSGNNDCFTLLKVPIGGPKGVGERESCSRLHAVRIILETCTACKREHRFGAAR